MSVRTQGGDRRSAAEILSGAKSVATYLLAACVVLGVWWIVAHILYAVRGYSVLPTPAETFRLAITLRGDLAPAFGNSALRFLISIVVAFVLAVPFGLVVGFSRRLHQYVSPLVFLTYPIPPVALLVFLYMAFGTGEAVRVFVVTIALFFQLLVAAMGAARQIPPSFVTSVRSAGATKWGLYKHVVLPATLPSMLTAARVSVGLGITLLYIAETRIGAVGGARSGLGVFIKVHSHAPAEYELSAVVGLALMGLVFYTALELLDRWLCRWRHVGGGGGT